MLENCIKEMEEKGKEMDRKGGTYHNNRYNLWFLLRAPEGRRRRQRSELYEIDWKK